MKKFFNRYLPILSILKHYGLSDLKHDGVAGVTVGIILIPQGMAYAVIAGLPPIYGLYASLVPLLVYPFFATSKHLSVGPVAIDMLILAAGLGLLVDGDMTEKITFAVFTAMMTGVLQILMGLFKLGFIFNLFSRPVVSGFTSAAPIIIIFSQLGTLFKIDVENSQFIHRIAFDLYRHIDQLHYPTLSASLIFIFALIALRKFYPRLPESVIIVTITLGVASLFDLSAYGIEKVGKIPRGLPGFDFNTPQYSELMDLFPTAVTLALIQFMSVASLTKSFSRKHNYPINPNQELLAIGSSNLLGSLFQSIPISGSFSRSAISEQAGTRTAISNFFAGLMILLTLLFLTPVFEALPMPLLGAIIVVSVFNLIDIKELSFLFNTKRRDAIVALITFISVLAIGIQEGIVIGIVASVIAILIKLSQPTVAELGLLPNSRIFKNIERFPEAKSIPGILILRIDASFSFVNAQFFKNYILEKSFNREQSPKYVIIDGSTIGDLDISAIDSLLMIIETLNEKGIELYISGLIGPVRDVIRNSDMKTFFKSDRFFNNVHEAVEAALHNIDIGDGGDRLRDYRVIIN